MGQSFTATTDRFQGDGYTNAGEVDGVVRESAAALIPALSRGEREKAPKSAEEINYFTTSTGGGTGSGGERKPKSMGTTRLAVSALMLMVSMAFSPSDLHWMPSRVFTMVLMKGASCTIGLSWLMPCCTPALS